MKIEINTGSSRNLKYDESLFEIYCLDYGDNYHKLESEPTSEFEREVRNIKARYKDLRKFNEALSIYNEWMSYLSEKHGGPEIFKKKLKAGIIDDYVPRKPRLKNIKTLKYLYKHNIVISKVNNGGFNIDKVNEYLNKFYPETSIKTDNMVVTVTQNKEAVSLSKDNNNIQTYKSSTFLSDAQFLNSFFMNKNKPTKKKSKKKSKKKDTTKFLITDLMKGYYDVDNVEESDNAPLMGYNGLLLSAGTTKDIDFYHKLDEAGWMSYKLMKRANYGKRVTEMFKAQKKSKKKKNKKKKSSDYDGLLIDIMTDNGYDDFEDFQKEMLSMTADDLYK